VLFVEGDVRDWMEFGLFRGRLTITFDITSRSRGLCRLIREMCVDCRG
jgi:hypothetical protein